MKKMFCSILCILLVTTQLYAQDSSNQRASINPKTVLAALVGAKVLFDGARCCYEKYMMKKHWQNLEQTGQVCQYVQFPEPQQNKIFFDDIKYDQSAECTNIRKQAAAYNRIAAARQFRARLRHHWLQSTVAMRPSLLSKAGFPLQQKELAKKYPIYLPGLRWLLS